MDSPVRRRRGVTRGVNETASINSESSSSNSSSSGSNSNGSGNKDLSNKKGINDSMIQKEIEKWVKLADKTEVSLSEAEKEAQEASMAESLAKLRELQSEILDTNWQFDSNYG
mmetsp:Transcript_36187/g.34219  ORF Transcript_36187/g.34219 Transcript_36187/m.34219 type:complete len:113 (+) Transcript_36187:74-412(+)